MIKKIVLIITLCLMTSTALAEDKQLGSEELQGLFQQQMHMMTPLFGQMMKIMMETQLEVLSKPETADKLAAYTRNYYEALIKKGFSKEEALKIAMYVGFPAFPAMQK